MDGEKTKELLNYLASIGFEGLLLEQAIRGNIDNGMEQFYANHEIVWENEKMDFSLKLMKDLQFNGYRLASYLATHIDNNGQVNNQAFTPTPRGICNANLAYYIVSGRFNDLFEKISILDLGAFPGVDTHQNLENMLSKNVSEFTLKCARNESEGYIEYKIPVAKINGWYALDTYTAILTLHPEITHGTFNSIDTKELEDEMRKVNWHNDQELYVLHDDAEPELLSPSKDILGKMLQLANDSEGSLIADKLMIKYWSDTSYFDSFIEQRAWDSLESLPKREQSFPVEIDAKSVFNMLCGRSILRNRVYPLPHDKPAWVRFDFTTVGPNGGYLTEVMPEFDEEKLVAVLSALPIPDDTFHRIAHELKRGDITPLELPDKKIIFLEANPEQKTVNIYSEDMRPIPFNLHFDPDWRPAQQPELKPEELKRKPRQNIIHSEYPPGKGNQFRRRR